MLPFLGEIYMGTSLAQWTSYELYIFLVERDIDKACPVLAVRSVHAFCAILSLFCSSSEADKLAIISETSVHIAQLRNIKGEFDWEIVYFIIIFTTRFIPFMYYEPVRQKCGQQTKQLYHMLLSTFLRWLDSVLFKLVMQITRKEYVTPNILQCKLAVRNLLVWCVF